MIAWIKANLLFVKLALLAALVIAAWLHGRTSGMDSVQRDWDRDKIARMEAQKKAVDDALFEVSKEHARQLKVNQEALSKHETDLKNARSSIARERAINDSLRLRFKAPDRGTGSATGEQAAGTGATDGTDGYVELPAAIAGGLRDLAESADTEMSQCVTRLTALQQWVRENGFYEQGSGIIPVPTNTKE